MNRGADDSRIVAESILLTIEEGVTIYDRAFRLVAWNEKYAEMGITPREHLRVGLSLRETYEHAARLGVFGPNEAGIVEKRLEQARRGTSPRVEVLRGEDGRVIEIRRYFLAGIGVAAVFSDATESRRNADKVKRAEELELLALTTAGLLHDFNNILQAVMVNLELADVEQDFGYLGDAMDAAKDGADLARSMLQIAKPETSRNARFDAISSINNMLNWIGRVLRANVSVEHISHGGGVMIEASQGRFTSALGNLIFNAHDALEHGGSISLASSVEDGRLRIDVVDDGCGMTEEQLKVVGQPFQTTKGEAGTGLGLVEVKRFVEGAGGVMAVHSTVGEGTVVTLWLPATLKEDAHVETVARAGTPSMSGRILLVEDRPDLRSRLQNLLEQCGCETLATPSGEAAWSVVSAVGAGYFDVVVSDVDLIGELSGAALAARVYEQVPDLPVILLTAASVSEEVQALASVSLLQKPVEFEKLAECLQSVLSFRRGS